MRKKWSCTSQAPAILAVLALGASEVQAQATSHFDLPSQPLADSLRAVAAQTHTNVLFDPDTVGNQVAPALNA